VPRQKRDNLAVAAVASPIGTIGREPELESIARFLKAVPVGPSALMMQGEAGIGKTTLWDEAVAAARLASFTVMCCRPARAEAELPYLGLADLFAEVPDAVVAELPVPQRKALDVALLRVEGEGPPLRQRAVAAAVLNALHILARSTPILVAIDDGQWLDSPSRRVLCFAVRRIAAAPVGVLVAMRSGEPDEDLLELGAALGAERLHRLTVGPLGLQALDRLLRLRLRAAFSGPTLRRLEQTSAGNPFFALELGRVLLDPEAATVTGQPLRAPTSLADLLSARIAGLSKAAREALLVASALSRPTVDLVRAASATPAAAAGALERAAQTKLITLRDGAVRFSHPLLASVVYSQASETELRRLHKRLAGVVVNAEERARHLGLSAAGPNEGVAGALDDAAECAARRGAPDAAAVLLEQATRLTPPSATDDVHRRQLDAADQHVAAGDTARARVLLEGVVAGSAAGKIRARALHRLGRVRVLEGAFSAAPPLLRRALEEVGEDLTLRAAIERDLVLALIQTGAVAEALPHARAGLVAAEASGDDIAVAEALDHLCMAEFSLGGGVDVDLLDRAITLDQRVGPAPLLEHPGMTTGRFPLALTLKWMDRFDAARDLLRSVYREHNEHGDEGSLAPVLFQLGELECWAGNWQTAARLAEEGHEVASRTGQAVAERLALTLEATVEACRGNVEAARRAGEASLALSERADDSRFMIRSLKALGFLELSLGNAEEAIAYLERGLGLEAAAGEDPAVLRIVPEVIEALLAAGRLQDARPLVDGLQLRGSQQDRAWARAAGARCRGLLEAASGELALSQSALQSAVREHERLLQPFELARTLLALGIVQRRSKKKRQARDSLGLALASFDELGARLWAERTRIELGRIGGRASSPLDLTPTEQRVAERVAYGQTNHEVAAELFMSVKTVEANLTHIYRKLGLSSRHELARWMRANPDRHPR
jgi:DNA-binding CsgD family transcriptional regulator